MQETGTLFCETTLKDTVEIYRTLACDMGLQIPAGHVYETFNIPKPRNGEALLQPRQDLLPAGDLTEGYQMKAGLPEDSQKQIDRIVELSTEQAVKLFEKMVQPLKDMVEAADSMESLQEALEDKNTLKNLYKKMDGVGLQDLVAQGLYFSELLGRAVDTDEDS